MILTFTCGGDSQYFGKITTFKLLYRILGSIDL